MVAIEMPGIMQRITEVIENLDELLKQEDWQTMYDRYFDRFPPANVEQIAEALRFFEKARGIYISKQQNDKVVECCLKLAQLYQGRDEFSLARIYVEDAEKYAHEVTNEKLRADLIYRTAWLCPDIGLVRRSITYTTDALRLYERLGEERKQVEALWFLAIQNRQAGDYDGAASRLKMANRRLSIIEPDLKLKAHLLNAEAYFQWYKGKLPQALKHARELKDFADAHEIDFQSVYARLLLGIFHQALGKYSSAQAWYEETRKMAIETRFNAFLLWVDLYTSWLKTLEGQYDEAQERLDKAGEAIADQGLRMSWNVFAAGLYARKEWFRDAEDLLQESFDFYKESGDEVALCAIRFHLAYIYLKTNREQTAWEYLESALQWMRERYVDYFPLWWHPQIVGEVCTYPLIKNVYLDVVGLIFKRLGKPAIAILRGLQEHESPWARKNANDLLRTIKEDGPFEELEHLQDGPIKMTLEDLLEHGPLRKDGFKALVKELRTASKRQNDNYTIVAVFGLYMRDYTRVPLAEKLDLSEDTVKNYITNILDTILGPDKNGFVGPGARKLRKDKVRKVAEVKGFIEKFDNGKD